MNRGAIILCGGESSRMGRDKAMLPFGAGEVMLQRVMRIVSGVVPANQVVCVAAPGQKMPRLPAAVKIVFDPIPHCGPLAALAVGLGSLEHAADAAFVTGCDAPLMKADFMKRMFDLLSDHEIAAPHDAQRWHPLAAVYRTGMRPRIDMLIAAGERSLVALLESCHTRGVTNDELRDVDPELASLTTCNTLEDYKTALRIAGLPSRE